MSLPPSAAVRVLVLALLAGAAPVRAGFVDATDATGTTLWGVTYGLAWGDLDVDGDPDAFVCRHFERPVIYRNHGDGTLSWPFFPPLFATAEDHHGPLLADLDGDGDLDIYLTGGADAGAGTEPKKMYRNDGAYSFVDVAAEWGLEDALARGRGTSAMDVDADGDVDLFVAKAARVASPNSLFLNDGTPFFVDVAAAAGLADDTGSTGAVWGDFDGDGDPDLLVSGEEDFGAQTRLWRNDGGATFTDVTAAALPGVGPVAAAAWGDADNDGDLDLALGEGDLGLFDAVIGGAGSDSILFFFNTRFDDNGLDGITFAQTGDSVTYDLAQDGFFQPASIFISEAAYHPSFSPFTLPFEIFGIPPFQPGASLGTYLWTQPIFAFWELRCNAPPTAGHSFAGVIKPNGNLLAVAPVGLEPYAPGPRGTRLWRNDGGTFADVTASAGVADAANVHHLDWVDVDQDGLLDLYVENKGDTATLNAPNLLYRNLGGGLFEESAAAFGLEGPDRGLGDAFAFEDPDLDGDLDVMVTSGTGPRFLAGLEKVRFYRNDGPVGERLRVDLVGVLSTRDGYGAWVTCVSPGAGRQVRYVTGNSWRGGQTMLDPWFGLGADAVVDTLRVEWPSGVVDVRTGVRAGVVTVVEADPAVGAPAGARPEPGPLSVAVGPSPSRGAVTLAIGGRTGTPARLEIRDVAGRAVHVRSVPAGVSRVVWDGRDGDGRPAAAGVYFVRVREGGRVADAKIVRLGP